MALKGLKTAIGDYKKANAGGDFSPNYGVIMYNRKTESLWVDTFNDTTHMMRKMYEDANIVDLLKWSKANKRLTDNDKVCMNTIKRLATECTGEACHG